MPASNHAQANHPDYVSVQHPYRGIPPPLKYDLEPGIIGYKCPLFRSISIPNIRNTIDIEVVFVPLDNLIVWTKPSPAVYTSAYQLRLRISTKPAIMYCLWYHRTSPRSLHNHLQKMRIYARPSVLRLHGVRFPPGELIECRILTQNGFKCLCRKRRIHRGLQVIPMKIVFWNARYTFGNTSEFQARNINQIINQQIVDCLITTLPIILPSFSKKTE